MSIVFRGSCSCGEFKYTSNKLPIGASSCFCKICQASSGSSHQSCIAVPIEALTMTCGVESLVLRRSLSGTRGSCPKCNDPLMMMYHCERLTTYLFLSTLATDSVKPEDRPQFVPKQHIFVSQQPFWYDSSSDVNVEQYDRFKGDFEDKIKQYAASYGETKDDQSL